MNIEIPACVTTYRDSHAHTHKHTHTHSLVQINGPDNTSVSFLLKNKQWLKLYWEGGKQRRWWSTNSSKGMYVKVFCVKGLRARVDAGAR